MNVVNEIKKIENVGSLATVANQECINWKETIISSNPIFKNN